MSERELTAVVLAGGLGLRLRPVIGGEPKVLAPVLGRPFLLYILDALVEWGFRDLVLCTGYGAKKISSTFGDRYGPLRLRYSREFQPLGTGGAVRRAIELIRSPRVLVANGDSYTTLNFSRFLDWHCARQSLASIWVTRGPRASRYGMVHANRQGEVTAFIENEDSPQRRSAPDAGRCEVSISGGVYLFERRFIESIPPFQSLSLERDVFPRWVGRGLYAYRKRARFIDIGTPESYAEAPVFFQRNSRLSLGVRRTGWFDSKRPA